MEGFYLLIARISR